MKQRLLAALSCVVLVLGLAPAALAAAPAEEEAAQVLAALDIMVGDESGNLNLGATVTRAEFTKLAVAASTSRDAVGDTVSVKPYPDVPQSHWAAPYIKAAVDLGLVQGDLHGNFNPGRSITLAEGVTIVLRLLGYQDSDFTAFGSGQMAQCRPRLNEGVTAGRTAPHLPGRPVPVLQPDDHQNKEGPTT
ncbi:MAG: S-layer homology domain-containing protein [Flavonifractor plautii]